jgi:hypothetical protein
VHREGIVHHLRCKLGGKPPSGGDHSHPVPLLCKPPGEIQYVPLHPAFAKLRKKMENV